MGINEDTLNETGQRERGIIPRGLVNKTSPDIQVSLFPFVQGPHSPFALATLVRASYMSFNHMRLAVLSHFQKMKMRLGRDLNNFLRFKAGKGEIHSWNSLFDSLME